MAPRLTLGDIEVTRQGAWVFVVVCFRKAPWAGYTVRLSTAWATVLWQRLGKVLGQ